ncbi:MAG: conjugal transfer protein TrbE [Marinicaulis sp.]|nr:conjugal transfer protein TrbE [Marinicaulis sp.]
MLNLKEYRNRGVCLADHLPWALLAAPGVVLNKDGSLQRTARYRGGDLTSATAEELLAKTARINNVLKRFGSGWALYFEAARIPAIEYPSSTWCDVAAWLVDEERRAIFEDGVRHFESEYYLTLAFLPPPTSVDAAEKIFVKREGEGKEPSYKDHMARFLMESDRSFDLLAEQFAEFDVLSDDETLTYLHSCVSSKRHPVSVPETPIYLDAILSDEILTGGLEPQLGDQHLRVIGVRGLPNMTEPGLLDALNRLDFSYRWSSRFLPLDKQQASKALTKFRRQWFAKRKSIAAIIKEVMFNEGSALVDSDADNKAADADAALQELGADDVAFGYLTQAIVVSDAAAKIADEKAREIERILNSAGFVAIRESVNAVEAWLGTLPGHAYANVRQPIVHSLNLAHMAPISAVWAGPKENEHLNGPPLFFATTEGATPFRFSTHIGDVGHGMVVGPTGAGKSVLLSLMALQFRRYENSQIFFFDKGGSAKATTTALGGAFYNLSDDAQLSFQPLARINQPQEAAWALEWLCDLFTGEGVAIEPDQKEAIWSALQNLASAPEKERTLTGLSVLLQNQKLKSALKPFTLDGAHGSLLDADNETLSLSDMAAFEMESLMHEKRLVAPVLSYLFHRLEERFDGSPTLLILDEAWVFLDNPQFAGRIREWLKTLRKKNVAVWFATQSLSDVASSSIAPAIIESCPSRIFLPNASALEPQSRETYERFGLNARQVEIIAGATPKRDYYLQSRDGDRLFDLQLGEVASAFCACGSKADQKRLDEVLEHSPGDAFTPAWLRACGVHWAANLIETPKRQGEKLCAVS